MHLDRNLYHPNKMLKRSGKMYSVCMDLWLDSIKEFPDVNDKEGFVVTLSHYLDVVRKRRDYLMAKIAKQRIIPEDELQRDEVFVKYQDHPLLVEAIQLRLAEYQVVMDWIIDTHKLHLYGQMMVDWRYRLVAFFEKDSVEIVESLVAEHVLRHAIKTYTTYGEKMYFVSPGLEQELRNTSVKGMPEVFFKLPYPTVYLVCPTENPFKVYHAIDGWHDVEGVYLVEDESVVPRTVRVIVIGKPNENATHAEDDAFYHWSLYLQEGLTMEECLDLSFDTGEGKKVTVRSVEGSDLQLTSGTSESEAERKIFKINMPQLRGVFTYVMNVILYVMHPDAEVRKFKTNAEYDNLRDRALKAKGKKRKKLFDQLNSISTTERYLLGGSIVVDRSSSIPENGNRVGSKHMVRTYVQGHWQSYLTGPRNGERVRVYRHKRPYWKGPKDGPISLKSHIIGAK